KPGCRCDWSGSHRCPGGAQCLASRLPAKSNFGYSRVDLTLDNRLDLCRRRSASMETLIISAASPGVIVPLVMCSVPSRWHLLVLQRGSKPRHCREADSMLHLPERDSPRIIFNPVLGKLRGLDIEALSQVRRLGVRRAVAYRAIFGV